MITIVDGTEELVPFKMALGGEHPSADPMRLKNWVIFRMCKKGEGHHTIDSGGPYFHFEAKACYLSPLPNIRGKGRCLLVSTLSGVFVDWTIATCADSIEERSEACSGSSSCGGSGGGSDGAGNEEDPRLGPGARALALWLKHMDQFQEQEQEEAQGGTAGGEPCSDGDPSGDGEDPGGDPTSSDGGSDSGSDSGSDLEADDPSDDDDQGKM